MKLLSIRSSIAVVTILFATVSANGQTENTGERLITQLKNGTAPGLLFAKNVPVAKPVNTKNVEQNESLISQIRKGTAPGMKFMPVTAATSTTMRTTIDPNASRAQPGPLASEQEIKKDTIKVVPAPLVIPNQEEVKNETPAGKQ